MTRLTYGGIAQLARAFGSYPECRWFESNCRYQFWPGGQEVKTPPFHGGNTGSIPVRVTIKKHFKRSAFLFYLIFTDLNRQLINHI